MTMTELTYALENDAASEAQTTGKPFEELYDLDRELGKGAFSVVRAGSHKSTGQDYAIKIIDKTQMEEFDKSCLQNEIQVLSALKHDHIIRLYDVFDSPTHVHLILEQVSGGELLDRLIAKSNYTEKEARDTSRVLLEAVQHCHAHHVAHRDLKAENLLLCGTTNDWQIKVADFGFAKFATSETTGLKTQCGSAQHVAPEILKNIEYGTKVDCWAMGVIVYTIIGGYPPFYTESNQETFQRILKGDLKFEPEYWSHITQDCKDMIKGLLTMDPTERWSADKALECNWIQEHDADDLDSISLHTTQTMLQQYTATQKLKAAIYAVIGMNRLQYNGEYEEIVIDDEEEYEEEVIEEEDEEEVDEFEEEVIEEEEVMEEEEAPVMATQEPQEMPSTEEVGAIEVTEEPEEPEEPAPTEKEEVMKPVETQEEPSPVEEEEPVKETEEPASTEEAAPAEETEDPAPTTPIEVPASVEAGPLEAPESEEEKPSKEPSIASLSVQEAEKPKPAKKTKAPAKKVKATKKKAPSPAMMLRKEPALSIEQKHKNCITTRDVYAAFTVDDCNQEPSSSDYYALAKCTREYYESVLRHAHGDNLLALEVSLRKSLFNASKPSDQYNVYVEWDIVAAFQDDYSAPTRRELCKPMVMANMEPYILDYIRPLSETPFARVTSAMSGHYAC